jgi:ketopantoate hydroxymethyltransferase
MSAENHTLCRAAGTNAVSVGDSVSATKMDYTSTVHVAPASPFSQFVKFFW